MVLPILQGLDPLVSLPPHRRVVLTHAQMRRAGKPSTENDIGRETSASVLRQTDSENSSVNSLDACERGPLRANPGRR